MVTKAIVEQIIDKYSARVRIPFYNKIATSSVATPTEDLYIATISCLPNSNMNYQEGDIVYIAFEDGYISRPVILGQLSRNFGTEQLASLNLEALRVNIDTHLSYDTYIGDITPNEIACLKGLNQNLAFQLEILTERVAKLEEQYNMHTYGCLVNSAPNCFPTEADVDYISKAAAGDIILDDWRKIAADVDEDGYITANDVLLVREFINDPTIGKYGKVGQNFSHSEE